MYIEAFWLKLTDGACLSIFSISILSYVVFPALSLTYTPYVPFVVTVLVVSCPHVLVLSHEYACSANPNPPSSSTADTVNITLSFVQLVEFALNFTVGFVVSDITKVNLIVVTLFATSYALNSYCPDSPISFPELN